MNYENCIERGDPKLERIQTYSLMRLAELEREKTLSVGPGTRQKDPSSPSRSSGRHDVALGPAVLLPGLHASETPAHPRKRDHSPKSAMSETP